VVVFMVGDLLGCEEVGWEDGIEVGWEDGWEDGIEVGWEDGNEVAGVGTIVGIIVGIIVRATTLKVE